MTESLLWLVQTIAELSYTKVSASRTTAFINLCNAGKVNETLPDAFTQWCQNNHISFSVADGANDCGMFDLAVQFKFADSGSTIIVIQNIGEGKVRVQERMLESDEGNSYEAPINNLGKLLSKGPVYLLNIKATNQLPEINGGPLNSLFKILMQDKKDILLVYVFAIFGGLINLTLPLGIQAIINLITMQQMNTSWWVLLLMVLLGVLFTGITQIFQLSIIETIQQRLFFRAAFTFSSKLPKIDMDRLTKYYPPELVNRFFDVMTVQKGMSKILMDFSTSTLQILFGLILLSFYHPFFIFFGFIWLAILIAIIAFTSKAGLRTSIEESNYKYKLAYWLQEIGRNLVTFKLSDSQQYIFQRTDNNTTGYLKARKAHFRILLQQFVTIVLFKFVVTGSLLIVGSILVVNQELNIGQFVAAEIIIILLMVSAEKLMLTMETVYDVLTSVDKLKKIANLPEDPAATDGLQLNETGTGLNIRFESVSFKYHDAQELIVKKLNISIAAGEKIAIKSGNQPGKTTILKLLSGLYTPTEGRILINDFPIENFRRDELLNYIGHNLDSGQIFNGNLEQNISLGRSGIDRKEILEVCRICDLMPLIQQLPFGLLTEFSAEDKRISLGIQKRISLARAIIQRPLLLIIDDTLPTLSQEQKTELWSFLAHNNPHLTVVAVTDDESIQNLSTSVYELKDYKLNLIKGGAK
jgi:ABC-type bacteriocin/lantibiotic exporter with double-glycine peptidase domain